VFLPAAGLTTMSSARFIPSMAQQAAHRAPAPVAVSNAPPGTFASGTKVQVGGHRVTIEKYLSEGGFAHVYLVRVPRDGAAPEVAVLKRVACADKDQLANMRTEVETMKKLKGHQKIVTYMDSHASQLKGGGYEVFLLMEYCSGGGLIDFMNTRLQHRLTEPEILHIFSDVAEGVATMHYLKPPLLHRREQQDLQAVRLRLHRATQASCDHGGRGPADRGRRAAAHHAAIPQSGDDRRVSQAAHRREERHLGAGCATV
jgi:AP2-associated kinase